MGALDRDETLLREPALCHEDKQPCIRERCNAWIHYRRADGQTMTGCAVVFTPVLLGELIVELQRTQAGVDKVATEVRTGAAASVRAALLLPARRPVPVLEGGG